MIRVIRVQKMPAVLPGTHKFNREIKAEYFPDCFLARVPELTALRRFIFFTPNAQRQGGNKKPTLKNLDFNIFLIIA